ncbi:MAG: hypothetical protein AAGK05_19790, partial [Pseudomonadota bacterium]
MQTGSRNTPVRTRKGSQNESLADDLKRLLTESETRVINSLKKEIDDLKATVLKLNSRMESIELEQIKTSQELDKVKRIVLSQQTQLEKYESEKRKL